MTQQQQEKDILGKILVTVSSLCLVIVAGLLIWGFVLD
ncbi:putative membrane protein [Serratia plymuthica A30]|nr:putative membrane protein [Serratia plymuthica A30]